MKGKREKKKAMIALALRYTTRKTNVQLLPPSSTTPNAKCNKKREKKKSGGDATCRSSKGIVTFRQNLISLMTSSE